MLGLLFQKGKQDEFHLSIVVVIDDMSSSNSNIAAPVVFRPLFFIVFVVLRVGLCTWVCFFLYFYFILFILGGNKIS